MVGCFNFTARKEKNAKDIKKKIKVEIEPLDNC